MVQVPLVKSGYRPQAVDTSIEADALSFMLLRQRTDAQRLQMASKMMRSARRLSLHCLRQQFAALSPHDLGRKIAIAWFQESCPPDYIPTITDMLWDHDPLELAAQLHGIFARLNIPYYVTGGAAAITYGEPRTTGDVDIVLGIPQTHLRELVQALEAEGFYVAGADDAGPGRCLSITHIESAARADLIISGDMDYERLRFARSRLMSIPGFGDIIFSSPEDVILSKLQWGKRHQSEKQWRDVLAVMKVQGTSLDFAYLWQWAPELGVADDLSRAFIEAGI